MRSIIIRETGGPEVLEVVDGPGPEAGPGEVVVRAQAIGVGWPDVLIRKGVYRWMPPLPASPGSELAGRIEAVGPGVVDLAIGEAVLVSARELAVRGGCYTERIAVPADSVFRLPASADLDEAAGIGNFQVAWGLLHEAAPPRPEGSVLIKGAAGGVGSSAVQLARLAGMTVLGTVSSAEKAAFARDQGADHLIDYRTENVVERVRELTDGRGVDLILDHLAGPAFAANFEMLAPWGTVVSFADRDGPPPEDVFPLIRERSGKCLGWRWFSMHAFDRDRPTRRRVADRVLGLLAEGRIRPRIAARFPLADAADAHRLLESGGALGRILLKP